MKTTGTIFLLISIIIYGCRNRGIEDTSKRNEKNIWFVDQATGKGNWVPYGDHTTITNGNYTAFYHNGKIREKGKLLNGEPFDTIYYYDLTETLVKYSIFKQDSSSFYYLNEGPYKSYSPMGELTIEGIVKNHRLVQIKWNGAFGHYTKVLLTIFDAAKDMKIFAKEFGKQVSQSLETSDSTISVEKLELIDSLFTLARISNEKSLDDLKNIEVFDEMPELKIAAENAMKANEEHLNNELPALILLAKQGFRSVNLEKYLSIGKKMEAEDSTASLFMKAQDNFSNKYEFTEEQIQFLMQNYPQLVE